MSVGRTRDDGEVKSAAVSNECPSIVSIPMSLLWHGLSVTKSGSTGRPHLSVVVSAKRPSIDGQGKPFSRKGKDNAVLEILSGWPTSGERPGSWLPTRGGLNEVLETHESIGLISCASSW